MAWGTSSVAWVSWEFASLKASDSRVVCFSADKVRLMVDMLSLNH